MKKGWRGNERFNSGEENAAADANLEARKREKQTQGSVKEKKRREF